MILDSGICSVFREEEITEPGHMPRLGYRRIGQSWFGELSFETSPVFKTENREEAQQDQRIRILQMRQIRANRDVCVLEDVESLPAAGVTVYRIARAWHGADKESGQEISDLSLVEVSP